MVALTDKAALTENQEDDNTSTQSEIKAPSTTGLTIFTAAVFIVGEMAGSGILALPKSMVDTGWSGVILIVLCALLSGYTGIILGRSWQILKDRFPMYRGHIRYPYPAIAFEAIGKPGRYMVTFCVNFTLFSVSCVFLLVAANNIQSLLVQVGVSVSFCVWVPIIAAILCPFTWLGTPKDFWPIAAIATTATGIACLLIFVQEMLDIGHYPDVKFPSTDFGNFFEAFGVILFAFGGHAIFPSVQHDMKDTRKFHWTVGISYVVVVLYYLPVSAAGYAVYGDLFITRNTDNILNILTPSIITTIVTIMITIHLIMGFIIVINPFCQELEQLLNIPLKFSVKRICVRSAVVALVLFVAETIPKFGIILGLVGGSTVTLLTFVFPSLFYIKLRRHENDEWPREKLEIWEYILHAEIILVGLVGGIASTYSVIADLANADHPSFTVPCYVNATASGG
ncbi:uncharacterized protein [Asterias amurensis]|uniref:uncharacterized protein n=1 Tax=Asterias amurensis TaxID=7602 RepID=UPI003AB7C0A4